jgi:pyruvate/2-oxoglutarate dehydrogenase complex dihydrolipoamide dehydrogenase (E3) component
MPEILPFMDADLAKTARQSMPGITFRLKSRVEAIEGSTVSFTPEGGAQERVTGDLVLMAVARDRPSGHRRRRPDADEPARSLGSR